MFARNRAADFEHDVGVTDGIVGDAGAGRDVVRIRDAGLDPGARFNDDVGPQGRHFLDGLRRRRDPVFHQIDFPTDGDPHLPVS